MKFTTKQLTTSAILLAICIISQYFKNISPYITSTIINTTLIIAVLTTGIASSIMISIILPITSFFIAGSPIMSAMPVMLLVVMGGNSLLVLNIYFFYYKFSFKGHFVTGLLLGSIIKSVFMGIMSIYIVFPIFGHLLASKLPSAQAFQKIFEFAKINFFSTQLITALLGSVLAYFIFIPLKSYIRRK